MITITSVPQAIDLAKQGQLILLDVREKGELSASGTAKGAVHIPLGLLPLKADPRSPDYDKRLAGKARARPRAAAITVPKADMARVSQAAKATLRTNTGDRSGGKNSPTKRAMLRAASMDNRACHSSPKVAKLATTSASTAAVNQQARQRASNSGGGSL